MGEEILCLDSLSGSIYGITLFRSPFLLSITLSAYQATSLLHEALPCSGNTIHHRAPDWSI